MMARAPFLAAAALVLAAGCAERWDPGSVSPTAETSPFERALVDGYQGLATAERGEQDWEDAAHFVERARLAAMAADTGPQPIEQRRLPADAIAALTGARARLIDVLSLGAPLRAPAASAAAQTGFDCWMQEQEENRQDGDIEACRERFEAALAEAEDSLLKGDVIVLLPGEDGTVGGAAVATADGRSLNLTGAGAAAEVRAGDPDAGGLVEISEAEIADIFGRALDAKPPTPRTFTLIFETGTVDLTPASVALLDELLAEVERRTTVDVAVTGHTDTVGRARLNARLARDRAQLVADRLIGIGIDPDLIEVTSQGEANPVVPTPDETPEPRNRRVEVTVR